MAWGHSNWNAAIQAWFDEVHDFGFGVGSTNGKAVGHYTQVNKPMGGPNLHPKSLVIGVVNWS